MDILLAIILGTLFGYVLQRIGAADPDKIIGMLRLTDLHLMKVILAGIGISSALLFAGLLAGIFETVHFDIKAMYWGVIIGGLMLGFGWAIGGYCPGTGVAAAGSGRVDGLFFILGGLVGAGLYTVTYRYIEDTWVLQQVFGGKTTLVTTGHASAIINLDWSPILAITLGLLMLLIAKVLPSKEG
jgi:hypothetical protein